MIKETAAPSFTIDARCKFAPKIAQLLSDMLLEEGDDLAFLELSELSSHMKIWQRQNPINENAVATDPVDGCVLINLHE